MRVARDEAISLAVRFTEAHGYRVVPSIEYIPWSDEHRHIRFDAARWIGNHWAVVFDKQLPPGVFAECPGDVIVDVDGDSGECVFFPGL